MACDYCYEESSRLGLPEQISLDENGILSYLNEITEREKDGVSTVVIMGGEPFMKPNLVYAAVEIMGGLFNHKWGASIVTNGTLLDDNLSYIKNLIAKKRRNVSLTFEVSYDGSGHFRRVYRDSGRSSKEKVEQTIENFIKNKIPFKISYTIHKENYNNFIKDCIYIFERFGTEYLDAIKISPYCQELSDNFGHYFTALDKLKPYANILTKKYGVPICDLVCGVSCFKCDKSNFVGKSFCGPDGIGYDGLSTNKIFDSWGKNE